MEIIGYGRGRGGWRLEEVGGEGEGEDRGEGER